MRRLKAFVQSLYICETTIKNLRKFYYKAISVVVVVDGGGGGDAVIVAIVLLLLLLLVMRHGLTENDGRQQQSCRPGQVVTKVCQKMVEMLCAHVCRVGLFGVA
jgi:hypothetical protein